MANERPRDPQRPQSSRPAREEPRSSEHVVEGEGRWWTDLQGLHRVSWGAVFAGAIVALVVQLALGLLGLSIGMGIVDPAGPTDFEGLGIGAGIWILVSTIIAFFIGGWVAAHLAGLPIAGDGALHGVLTWGLVSLFTFFMMTTAVGQVISGAAGIVGQGVSTVAEATGEQEAPPRQVAVDMLTTYTDMTRAEAEEAVSEAEEEVTTEVEEEAPEAAEQAASVASQAALWAFLAMIIGLAAAAGGGMAGTPRDLPAASHAVEEH